jgi:hypothetical protein
MANGYFLIAMVFHGEEDASEEADCDEEFVHSYLLS